MTMNELHLNLHGHANTRAYLFDGLLKILGDDGLAMCDGFEASNPQRDYSQRWAETIARSDERHDIDSHSPAGLLLASADTGTGKTIGFGVPLLLRAAMGRRVAIATHSHALQKQYLGTPEKPGDIFKIVSWIKALGLGQLKIARRMGRQAFISKSAVQLVISQMRDKREALQLSAADFSQFDAVVNFAEASNSGASSGLIEDLREDLGGELPLGISASSICLDADSPTLEAFAYDAHLVEANSANVIIVSHAHLAACAMYRGAEILDGPVDAIVIDEADRLSEVAASAYTFEVSLRRSSAVLASLPGRLAKTASVAVEQLTDYVQSLFTHEKSIIVSDLLSYQQIELLRLAENASKSFDGVVKHLKNNLGSVSRDSFDDLQRQEAVINQFVRGISPSLRMLDGQAVDTQEHSKGVFVAAISFSPVHSLPSLMVMPVDPGRLMSRFWNLRKTPSEDGRSCALNSVLLTSATLGAPGYYPDAQKRFSEFARDLGISMAPVKWQASEFELWAYFEPEEFGRVRFVLADPSVPDPTLGMDDEDRAVLNPPWLAYCVQMIRAAHKAGGRTLVLVNSYNDCELLAGALLGFAPNIIQQLRGQSARDCQARFLDVTDAIWISPTAWEGLNLPGSISNLVIARLPFMPPDPTKAALLRAYSAYTQKSVDSILHVKRMNALKRKTRQGMFRPIRSKTDQARIWVADPRFPMHPQSQLPLRHPEVIKYSPRRRYLSIHAVVPKRFQKNLELAQILLQSGEFLS